MVLSKVSDVVTIHWNAWTKILVWTR